MKSKKEEQTMNRRWIYWLSGVVMVLVLFSNPQGWTQPKQETEGPIITQAFAVDKGYYGSIWKIYIEAKDPDGKMLKIATTVDQVGFGHYPTNWVYLKPQHGKYLKGYLQWNTFSSKASNILDGTQITVKVSIFDKAGNASKEVVFPFTFQSEVRGLPSLPAPFDQGDNPRLGYISIDLSNQAVIRFGD
jgi:hypothetical protein